MSELSITPHPEGGYLLHAEAIIPRPLEVVFAFFADAMNLQRLTPPWVRFSVLTPAPIPMFVGQRIDYRLRIHGLPMRWQSEITAWEPARRFIDEQRRGPYRFWRHEHLFHRHDAGTRVVDQVHYGVPGGRFVHSLIVRRDVERIFRFRAKALESLFSPGGWDSVPVPHG